MVTRRLIPILLLSLLCSSLYGAALIAPRDQIRELCGDLGYTLAGSTYAARGTYLAAVIGESVNVLTYGAKGDGLTNDTAAIQAAIDATPDGGVVLFPAGFEFKVTGTPVVSGRTNLILSGYGSTITLSGTNARGFKLDTSNDEVTFQGFTINGDGVLASDHAGIANDTSPSATVMGNHIRVVDCRISNVVRGVYFNTGVVGNWRDIVVDGCYINTTVGNASGKGYGIVLSGVYGGSVINCYCDKVSRHSIYISVSKDITVSNNTVRRHRYGEGTGTNQYAGMAISRSSSVTVSGNHFDSCEDLALGLYPHDTSSTAHCRGLSVIGNTFRDSTHRDLWIGTNGRIGTESELSDISVANNTFWRSTAADVGMEAIRYSYGDRVTITGNTFYAPGSYTLLTDAIYMPNDNAEACATDVLIEGNIYYATAVDPGRLAFVQLGTAYCTGTNRIMVRGNVLNLTDAAGGAALDARLIEYQTTPSNPNIQVYANSLSDYTTYDLIPNDVRLGGDLLSGANAIISGTDTTNPNARICAGDIGTQGIIGMRRAQGTLAARTACTSGMGVGDLNFEGFDGSGYGILARLRVQAAENLASGEHGGDFLFQTCAVNSATITSRWKLAADGTLSALAAHNLTTTGNVTAAGFLAGAAAGIDASIVIPAVGTITVTKGIITAFTAPP